MATITNFLTSSPSASDHLRSFDVRRDLSRVADLVEQCFADTLDPDGQTYLRHMRSASRNPFYLHWASAAAEHVAMPLSGYVWEEDDRLVGNLTLIPYSLKGSRCYLIANVAVHPDYRRRGIARSLTAKGVEHARQHGAQAVWLHVREENLGAFNLYHALGFTERARRTTWQTSLDPDVSADLRSREWESAPIKISIGRRRSGHWLEQRSWLGKLYPPELTWHLALKTMTLRPGLLGALYRLLTDTQIRQWAAWRGNQLLGVISWQAMPSFADALWLATSPEYEELITGALLRHARLNLSSRRPLSLDYPAGRAVQSIRSAGFHPHQTLIWMQIEF